MDRSWVAYLVIALFTTYVLALWRIGSVGDDLLLRSLRQLRALTAAFAVAVVGLALGLPRSPLDTGRPDSAADVAELLEHLQASNVALVRSNDIVYYFMFISIIFLVAFLTFSRHLQAHLAAKAPLPDNDDSS